MSSEWERDKADNVRRLQNAHAFRADSLRWIAESARHNYSYNFSWLGRPIIQYPQDIIAMQELLWSIRPQLVVETGVAHGGSLVFYASVLELIGEPAEVLGIDIEIRPHNRKAIEAHPLAKRIKLLDGSSIADDVVAQVNQVARGKKVLVTLDSNHTHDHVARELQLYSPLVKKGSYLVVFDTIIEDMPKGSFPDRPWDPGNSPKTAVREFLASNDRFVIDNEIEAKLQISTAPSGYLRCVKD
jgi:cephalosporin hydroxylase